MFDDQSVIETEAGEAVIEDAGRRSRIARRALAARKRCADENYNKFLLAMADFENYKKRMQRDIESIVTARRRTLLERFLPVLDNLERALRYDAAATTLRGGIEQTLKGSKPCSPAKA